MRELVVDEVEQLRGRLLRLHVDGDPVVDAVIVDDVDLEVRAVSPALPALAHSAGHQHSVVLQRHDATSIRVARQDPATHRVVEKSRGTHVLIHRTRATSVARVAERLPSERTAVRRGRQGADVRAGASGRDSVTMARSTSSCCSTWPPRAGSRSATFDSVSSPGEVDRGHEEHPPGPTNSRCRSLTRSTSSLPLRSSSALRLKVRVHPFGRPTATASLGRVPRVRL